MDNTNINRIGIILNFFAGFLLAPELIGDKRLKNLESSFELLLKRAASGLHNLGFRKYLSRVEAILVYLPTLVVFLISILSVILFPFSDLPINRIVLDFEQISIENFINLFLFIPILFSIIFPNVVLGYITCFIVLPCLYSLMLFLYLDLNWWSILTRTFASISGETRLDNPYQEMMKSLRKVKMTYIYKRLSYWFIITFASLNFNLIVILFLICEVVFFITAYFFANIFLITIRSLLDKFKGGNRLRKYLLYMGIMLFIIGNLLQFIAS